MLPVHAARRVAAGVDFATMVVEKEPASAVAIAVAAAVVVVVVVVVVAACQVTRASVKYRPLVSSSTVRLSVRLSSRVVVHSSKVSNGKDAICSSSVGVVSRNFGNAPRGSSVRCGGSGSSREMMVDRRQEKKMKQKHR